MKGWMVERRFRLSAEHPTAPGYVTPIRSVATGKNQKEAAANANKACEEALSHLTNYPNPGEWVGDAVVLYAMGEVE